MKKVLALVLAVMMLCTMAFAVTIIDGSSVVTKPSDSFKGDVVDLTNATADKSGYFYAQLGDNLFNTISTAANNGTALDITAKNFKVTLTAANAEFVFGTEGTTGHGYIRFKGVDKVLDDKADVTISALKIELLGYGTSYITMNAKDGVLEFGKCVFKGNTVYDGKEVSAYGTAMGLTADTFKSSLKAEYDVGYEPVAVAPGTTLDEGWYIATAKGAFSVDTLCNVIGSVNLAKDATIKVTPYDDSKNVWTEATVEVNKAIAKASNNAVTYGSYYGGVVATEKVTATINAGDDVYLYTVNNDGTVSASPFTFADGKGWTYTGTDIPLTVVSAVKLTTVAGGNTPGTTTNPGTGANDVVGVAAALAVVALVSGAAISLKK